MVLLHVFGGLIAAAGLVLFILDQLDDKEGKDADLKAGTIVVSGPAALVLIVVGALIFTFPFTSFYKHPEDPNPPVTLPPEVSTTVASDTTGVPSDTTMVVVELPVAPTRAEVFFDDACDGDALFWDQEDIDLVWGWWISVQAFTFEGEFLDELELDTGVDELTFGNSTAVCLWEAAPFVDVQVDIWIYAYNSEGYSEPLYISYP